MLNGKSILRHYGHVESPNYPHVYPPNVQCQCYLSTDEDAQIQLKVLDVRLARDTFSDVCGPDWLGYTRTHAQAWGTGTKLCDKQPGKIIDTGAHEIRLDFLSDSNIEERGFWIQYSGRTLTTTLRSAQQEFLYVVLKYRPSNGIWVKSMTWSFEPINAHH